MCECVRVSGYVCVCIAMHCVLVLRQLRRGGSAGAEKEPKRPAMEERKREAVCVGDACWRSRRMSERGELTGRGRRGALASVLLAGVCCVCVAPVACDLTRMTSGRRW